MNCLHLTLHLILRYEDLQDVLVHGHAEASVLTLHCETLSASSCSASTVQPLPQPALLRPGRPHDQRIHRCNHVCGTDRGETQRQPCRDIKYSHLRFNTFHSTYMEHRWNCSGTQRTKQIILLYIQEIKKTTRVDYKIKLRRSGHSHSDGNKRHTGVLTCPAPSQLDHKAIGQVSLSV